MFARPYFEVGQINSGSAILIPVYNEHQVLGGVLRDVLSTFANVVCVDDGSADNFSDVIRTTNAVLVSHPMNLGQGAALQTGIEAALKVTDVNYIDTFDSDRQHSVRDAEAMDERLRQGGI